MSDTDDDLSRVNTALAKFDDLKQIGEGTYGVVYRGTHLKSKRLVALKKISLDRDTEGVPSTCLREISILKDLNHPNIVRLYDVIHSGMHLYLVFEFIDRDLKMLLDKLPGRRLPETYLKSFMWQLFQALAYCHTRRVIHRDIKPQNILVNNEGVVKLADFGLARNYSLPSRVYTHEVVTLWYRAPEVLLGSKYYSAALDVWSMGCIFAEMAIGKSLFPGDSEIDQLFRIFRLLGTPTPSTWPGVNKMPDYNAIFPKWEMDESVFARALQPLSEDGMDLVKNTLIYIPEARITAKSCLAHRYFRDVNMRPPSIQCLISPPSENNRAERDDGNNSERGLSFFDDLEEPVYEEVVDSNDQAFRLL